MNLEQNKEDSNSKLSTIYELLNAHFPLEMSQLYDQEDQKLMKSGEWDYDNPNLITNKVKDMLEQLNISDLTEKELSWRNEILWFWYHHAISCAMQKNDQAAAQHYSEIALAIQPEIHPNKITRLLYYLVRDDVSKAEAWAETITKEPESSTARGLISEYKTKGFFRK